MIIFVKSEPDLNIIHTVAKIQGGGVDKACNPISFDGSGTDVDSNTTMNARFIRKEDG